MWYDCAVIFLLDLADVCIFFIIIMDISVACD